MREGIWNALENALKNEPAKSMQMSAKSSQLKNESKSEIFSALADTQVSRNGTAITFLFEQIRF